MIKLRALAKSQLNFNTLFLLFLAGLGKFSLTKIDSIYASQITLTEQSKEFKTQLEKQSVDSRAQGERMTDRLARVEAKLEMVPLKSDVESLKRDVDALKRRSVTSRP